MYFSNYTIFAVASVFSESWSSAAAPFLTPVCSRDVPVLDFAVLARASVSSESSLSAAALLLAPTDSLNFVALDLLSEARR